ncbi:hypothetical protein DXG01_006280 [Tephrocybe rancida]|nr:hypothetical protein DXG01_006280 [Tephrocybe rancida]
MSVHSEKHDLEKSPDSPRSVDIDDPDAEFGGTEARRKLERKLLWKVDLRMSIMVIIYILNYIDRNNAGAARLRGFEADLKLKGQEFPTLLSILYVGYIIMQIPSNMFLNWIGRPSLYLPFCMIVWGMISVLTGITHNFVGALLTRFFLGFVEAAFFPGALFLLSKWYKKNELGLRTAILYCGNIISNAFGSLIASGILSGMQGKLGHAAWRYIGVFISALSSELNQVAYRWLFYIEGALTIAVAAVAIFVLPDFPTNTRWLSPEERALAIRRMEEDAGVGDEEQTEGQGSGLWLAVTDIKVWWLALALTSQVVALSFNAFFPTLSATLGFNTTVSLLLCAPPFVFTVIVSALLSYHSDKVGERFYHIVSSFAVGILGFVIAISTMNTAARYVSLFLMAQSYAGFVVLYAWTSNTFPRPPSKRAVALALINAFSQLGNIAGSYVWPKTWGPTYRNSYAICISCSGFAILLLWGFRQYLISLNKKLDREEEAKGIKVKGLRHSAMSTTRLLQDWSFTQVGGGAGTQDGEWLQTSEFPTTVHVELLKLNKIPDPFLGLNEWDVQWVGESEWAFKSTFEVTEEELRSPNVDLVFDGLDTFAKVDLNGQTILETTNQFIAHRVAAKETLKVGTNELLLTFESAFLKGRDIEKQHEKLALWNGDSSRLHVRKAQYNYGWDWGPILMTVGPWKPVSLQTYKTRIVDLDIRSDVSEALDVKLTADLTLSSDASGIALFVLKAADGSVVASTTAPADAGHVKVAFEFPTGKVDLWYPVGYGKQPLYTVEAKLSDEAGAVLDTKNLRIAFRRARVVQDKLIDQEGLTFLFEINNVRIFCGGSVTPERYRAWLQLMVDGNQNMVRVWGGGIYEYDVFYDICDVLVWQDFMFGCGQYPAYDSFLGSVEVEVDQNVKRLRHHPSIVIFAGNNEDYQVAESLKLELNYDDETSDFRKTNFPARHIYEVTLPNVVNKNCDIHYHRGSPYSGQGKPTTDKTLGDIHQWNVWHGSQEPWHNWDILAGRFVSEFGMINNNHNKADGFERRLELYLVENFKHSFEMESYIYYTQVMQAETLASAYRLWRRNWGGKGREYTAGALVWQINDCWPVTSWAIVDYFLRPKPAFFTVARELRPFTVGMTRKDHKTFEDERSVDKFTIETKLEIWGTNSTLADKKATLEVTSFDLHSEWRETTSTEVVLAPNASTELFKGILPGQPVRTKASEVPRVLIVSARLIDTNGEVLGRYSNWPEPFKFIKFPAVEELGLKATVGPDGESVVLSTNKPIKGVVLDVEGDDVKWSDQAIDLVPHDPQTVKAVGLAGRQIKLRYLGDGSA